jgi:hypothetical protein
MGPTTPCRLVAPHRVQTLLVMLHVQRHHPSADGPRGCVPPVPPPHLQTPRMVRRCRHYVQGSDRPPAAADPVPGREYETELSSNPVACVQTRAVVRLNHAVHHWLLLTLICYRCLGERAWRKSHVYRARVFQTFIIFWLGWLGQVIPGSGSSIGIKSSSFFVFTRFQMFLFGGVLYPKMKCSFTMSSAS